MVDDLLDSDDGPGLCVLAGEVGQADRDGDGGGAEACRAVGRCEDVSGGEETAATELLGRLSVPHQPHLPRELALQGSLSPHHSLTQLIGHAAVWKCDLVTGESLLSLLTAGPGLVEVREMLTRSLLAPPGHHPGVGGAGREQADQGQDQHHGDV